MYIRTTILLIRKTVNSMMLLAVFLSAFGGGNFSFVHAKAEISKIPASTSQENHLNRVRGENSGNFDNVKAVMAQTTGTHKITYFHDNKAGAISVTFDDGYTSEATTGVSQLNARGLKGTFFVITDSDWVSDHVSWSTWRSVVAQGHEVASHTVNHQDLSTLSESEIRWELDESQMSISQNVPNQACASLAYPFTNSNSTVQDIAADYYVAARSGWVSPGRFLNHYQSGSDQYGSWNVINFYTIASMNGDSLGSNNAYLNDEYFNDSLDAAISRHAWFSLHFHEITSATEFGNILDYIQEKPGYWIDTFCDISRYMKERMNSTVQVVTDNTSEIRLRIVMNASLSTDTYNFPLTMRSTVPASWTEVEFQQGSTDDELTPVTEGSEKVVYYDAVPNGGDVVLTDSGNSTDPPSAFSKTSPANGASDQSLSPTLSWSASTGAASYEYCYDTSNDSACSSWTSNGTSTSKTLSGLNVSTTYYWHVRAVNAGGTTYADGSSAAYRSFTTVPNPPAAFGKTSPANGATDQPISLTLSWGASTGAASYEYCYDTSNDNACSGWTGNGTSTSKTLSGLSTSTTYYWHVRAVNAGGATYADGSNTVYRSFTTIPNLPAAFAKTSPANGATNQPISPTLSWAVSTGAVSYEYCYDTSNDNACSSWTSNGTSTSKALINLTRATTYYWHIRAINVGGTTYADGSSTAYRSFTTIPNPPAAFNKSSPANGAVNQPASLTLSWAASTGAASYEYCYDTSNDNACSSWTSNGTSTSKALSGLSTGTTYYWHVRAVNGGGTTYANNNSSTAFWSFTRSCYTLTRNVTPSTGGAVNASPAANCNNGTQYTYGTTVTLTAVPSADASFFAWSGDASGDSNPVNVVMTANKTVTAVFATFTETLSAPTLRSPRSNLVTLNKMPTLLWTSVTGGQSYEIVSARDSDFTNIVESKMVNGSSYTAASAFGDGKYYWRVRAHNASKQFGKWSTSRAFTIDTTGPSAPVPSFPANNGFVTRTPTFKWLIVPTAVIYEFQYDNNSNFSSPVNTLAVRANFRKPPAMPVGIYYWRVRAQDSAGNWGAWSVSFKVTLIGP